ncbi:hypothetical protein MYU51_005813 [Penicillium brevicompactum]|uniref:uncharacterized protein n=1 Tax=Penicillium brevicompactum TaxID=5074 RepID=UPI0025417EAC|nr:uncharacterized protein N7506_004742 [Penicillium brevicompactum]KAJ5336720.1 hypothetical protein N7506_004742 [Penicillium brevicompactum]
MAPELPGFYYDEVKRKYFKIQANHQASQQAKYTQDDVKRRKLDTAESQRAAAMNDRQTKERVRRSRLLTSSSNRLLEELGSLSLSHDDMLSRRGIQCAIANFSKGSHVSVCYPVEDEHSRWQYSPESQVYYWQTPSLDPCCSSISPTGHVLAGLFDHQGSELRIFQIPPPDDGGKYLRPECPTVHLLSIGNNLPRVATPLSTGTIPIFAIGLQSGLNLLTPSPDGWTDLRPLGTSPTRTNRSARRNKSESTSDTDVWAAEFLTPNTIAAGGKGKSVFVADSRTSADGAVACKYGALVTDIKAIDEHRIVVGGTGRSRGPNRADVEHVVTYDLRYKKESNGKTVPYRQYPGLNFAPPWPRFDVCPELGLLATVNRAKRPCFMSLTTGQIVETPAGESDQTGKVKFDRGHDDPQWRGPRSHSLLVSTQGAIHEWS